MGEVRLGLVSKVMRWVRMGFVNWIREHVLWSQSENILHLVLYETNANAFRVFISCNEQYLKRTNIIL